MSDQHGFTFIELMFVIVIVGILAAIALPSFNAYKSRAHMAEGLSLAGEARRDIQAVYDHRGRFPENNAQSGLPRPDAIAGKYVKSLTVENGAIHIRFREDINSAYAGQLVSLLPAIRKEDPTCPVVWCLGDEQPMAGYELVGEDKTTKK